MNGFMNDLRFGIRQLASKPGFAAAAIITLALGIGANTAVFSVLNGYLLKPLPYPHSEQLVQINENQAKQNIRYAAISVPNYLSMVNRTSDFSALAAYREDSMNLSQSGRAEAIPIVRATASLFDVLKVRPKLGQTFNKDNQQRGRGHVVVASFGFWQNKLGGNPNAVGETIRLNGETYTVVGVMPRRFVFLNRSNALFVPFIWTAKDKAENQRRTDVLHVIGRLEPGISVAAAGRQLDAVLQHVAHISASMRDVKEDGVGWWLQPWHAQLVSGRQTLLLLLQAAVLLVLLITCVNVANLLLARILGRTHEMAMRSALGASRFMLARQLFVEALCLAIPGGALGVGLAWWALELIRQTGWGASNSLFSIAPDWRVALFALAAAILVAIVISLLPIRYFSRADVQSVLQEGSRTSGGGRGARRARSALVVAELALATALLAGSGLLIHSFVKLQAVNPGFNPDHVLTAEVTVPLAEHKGLKSAKHFYSDMVKRVQMLPGATAAGAALYLPLHCGLNGTYGIVGQLIKPTPAACLNFAGNGYFSALGIAPVTGRGFGPQDTTHSEPVAVVDRLLARKRFPDGDAVGRSILWSGIKFRIVGVVPTVKTDLAEQTTRGMIYFSLSQARLPPYLSQIGLYLAIRTKVPPQSLIRPLTNLVTQLNPLASVSDVKTMRQIMAGQIQNRQSTMLLMVAFGAIALALAIVGVYGVMSYAVNQRRAECGVRLALGALPEDLSWLVLKDGLRLLTVGLVIGLGLAVLFGYLMSAQLFGVAPFDPLTLIGSAVVLCAITLAACWLPARRAARLDPAVAMIEQ